MLGLRGPGDPASSAYCAAWSSRAGALLRCNPFSHGGFDPVAAQRLFRSRPACTPCHLRPIPVFKPLIDVFDAVITLLPRLVGLQLGPVDHRPDGLSSGRAPVPLTVKQFKSMQALQRLAPEIKKLQEKYKDDKQRLNQEMMKFYQENKVNPFGSCLPLVLQLPVFISLFYMLRKDLQHRHLRPSRSNGRPDRAHAPERRLRQSSEARRSSCSSRTSRDRPRAPRWSCCSSSTSARSCSRAC